MKRRILRVVLGVGGIVVLLIGALLLWGHSPSLFSKVTDVDINSGDIRHRVFCCRIKVGKQIVPSAFSQEVRRLQIPVPKERVWKRMAVKVAVGRPFFSEHDGAVNDCDFLLEVLDLARASDRNRIAILERALSNLQAGRLGQNHQLVRTVIGQLGAAQDLSAAGGVGYREVYHGWKR